MLKPLGPPGSEHEELLVKIGRIAGIGGICVGAFFVLFREFIRGQFFPTLERADAYRILLLFVLFTFAVAIAGLGVGAAKSKHGRPTLIILLVFALAMAGVGAIVINTSSENAQQPRKDNEVVIVAGRVVDADNGTPLGRVIISLDRGGIVQTTDDLGNFKIDLKGPTDGIRMKLTKDGYEPTDRSVEPPIEDLHLAMKRAR